MKKLVLAWLALLGIGFTERSEAADKQADFYVSVDGDDRWSGTLPLPNAQSSDGPLARAIQNLISSAKPAIDQLRSSISSEVSSESRHFGATLACRLCPLTTLNRHRRARLTYAAVKQRDEIRGERLQVDGWMAVRVVIAWPIRALAGSRL